MQHRYIRQRYFGLLPRPLVDVLPSHPQPAPKSLGLSSSSAALRASPIASLKATDPSKPIAPRSPRLPPFRAFRPSWTTLPLLPATPQSTFTVSLSIPGKPSLGASPTSSFPLKLHPDSAVHAVYQGRTFAYVEPAPSLHAPALQGPRTLPSVRRPNFHDIQ